MHHDTYELENVGLYEHPLQLSPSLLSCGADNLVNRQACRISATRREMKWHRVQAEPYLRLQLRNGVDLSKYVMRTMITTYTQSLPTSVSQCDLSDLSYWFFSVTVIVMKAFQLQLIFGNKCNRHLIQLLLQTTPFPKPHPNSAFKPLVKVWPRPEYACAEYMLSNLHKF